MTNKILPALDSPGLVPSQTTGSLGSPLPIPFTEPGYVADALGDLWSDAFGDRIAFGEFPVTSEQALAAGEHGWEPVPGSEKDGKVTVRRPDRDRRQD